VNHEVREILEEMSSFLAFASVVSFVVKDIT
jgi:hypothetical protein